MARRQVSAGRAPAAKRRPATRSRLTPDQAILAVLLAAMDANAHVSAGEGWRAHHLIWSMRRFRGRRGEVVDRLIGKVRDLMAREGKAVVLKRAADALPARHRKPVFAVAIDLMLSDLRLERAEAAFARTLATLLRIDAPSADDIVRVMLIKNAI